MLLSFSLPMSGGLRGREGPVGAVDDIADYESYKGGGNEEITAEEE